jgi:predicted dehydrogenase
LGGAEFDRVRFLTDLDFTKVIGRSRRSPVPETNVDDSYLLLAELTNGVLGDFHLEFMVGQRERRTVIVGSEGTLTLTDQRVLCQGRDDNEPVLLQLPEVGQAPEGAQPGHEALRQLLADFCTAIRRGDTAHESVPHLPTFADGLRVQEIIAAAERSESERRWVNLAGVAE